MRPLLGCGLRSSCKLGEPRLRYCDPHGTVKPRG
jgi:hypothetical protein